MATKASQRQGNGLTGRVGGNPTGRGSYSGVNVDDRSGSDGALGILIAMVSLALVLFLMALTAFIYIDILGAKAEVKEQLIKLERLRTEVQSKLEEK